jgi:hypothetical protein
MIACRAEYGALGSAERPDAPELARRQPLDVLDVADLESESEHGYLLRPAAQSDDVVVSEGERIDGARRNRTHDRFQLRAVPGALLVARLGASESTRVDLRVNGVGIGSWSLQSGDFQERSASLPASTPATRATVELSAEAGKRFTAAHVWIYPPEHGP